MELTILSKEQFDVAYVQLGINTNIDREFLYEGYKAAMAGAEALLEANVLGKIVPINSVAVILYLANEIGYFLGLTKKTIKDIEDDEKAFSSVVSIALDKYFTNEHLNFKNVKYISKYSPIISTLEVYLNLVLGILAKYEKKNPKDTLVVDILDKGFMLAKAISAFIVDGFETEAFSTWRTLHENECILTIISKYGKACEESYLKHMKYAIAYRGGIESKEETDKVFVQIKEEMHKLGLKSKDMKKFIEYGWLTSVPGYNEVEGFKFNFRDGVERLAGLSVYSNLYEMASEIAHSSPLLIYSRKDYYFHLSLLILYESFFRLERIFTDMYLSKVNRDEANRYFMMRNVYYKNLEILYNREKEIFDKIQQKN